LNDELISLLGQFCNELLGDERFKVLTEMFGQQCAADMLATKPEHYKKREYIHASYTGFSDFIALVEKFGAAHRKLLEEQTQEITGAPDVEYDDPSVHDIYSTEDLN
jgi:hypothetical protein